MMGKRTVRTKEQLQAAKDAGVEEIIVEGELIAGIKTCIRRNAAKFIGIGSITVVALALGACPDDSGVGVPIATDGIDPSVSRKITGIIPDDFPIPKGTLVPKNTFVPFEYPVGSYINAFEARLEYVRRNVEEVKNRGRTKFRTIINGKEYIINANSDHDYNFAFEEDFHVYDFLDALWVVAVESLIVEYNRDVLLPAMEAQPSTQQTVAIDVEYDGNTYIRDANLYVVTEGFLLNILKYGKRNYKHFLATENLWLFLDSVRIPGSGAQAGLDITSGEHTGFRVGYNRDHWDRQDTWARIKTCYHELGHGILRSSHPKTASPNLMNDQEQGAFTTDRQFVNLLFRNYVFDYLIPNNWPVVSKPNIPDIWDTIHEVGARRARLSLSGALATADVIPDTWSVVVTLSGARFVGNLSVNHFDPNIDGITVLNAIRTDYREAALTISSERRLFIYQMTLSAAAMDGESRSLETASLRLPVATLVRPVKQSDDTYITTVTLWRAQYEESLEGGHFTLNPGVSRPRSFRLGDLKVSAVDRLSPVVAQLTFDGTLNVVANFDWNTLFVTVSDSALVGMDSSRDSNLVRIYRDR